MSPGRWGSFVAEPGDEPVHLLHEVGNPDHRLRVEHDAKTLLIHLSDEDGRGWTVVAVDRRTRRTAVAQARTQQAAARAAYAALNEGPEN
jgi:hypothetical protein